MKLDSNWNPYENWENEIKLKQELEAKREQGDCYYTTPLEQSQKAAEYLIKHAGKPVDFDWFHRKFNIQMDHGSEVFPYDTLNWHTYIWLKHKGYDYKLFCKNIKSGGILFYSSNRSYPTHSLFNDKPRKIIRYILVDKKDKIIWGNKKEKEHRVFNNEFGYYYGAYYNDDFTLSD